MLKSLINFVHKLFSSRKSAEIAQLRAELDRINAARTIRVDDRKERVIANELKSQTNYVTMPWADLNRYHKEVVDIWLAEIQDSIISLGYKEIPAILKEYRTEMIQTFVLLQKIALGEYSPELDNLEGLTREQLIAVSCELNMLQYEKRMIEQGKAYVTDGQKKVLDKYGLTASNRFEASRLIDEALRKAGVDTSKPYNNTTTAAQKNKIASIALMLGKEITVPQNKSEASKLIAEMQVELDNHPELVPGISEKQYEALQRLYKQCGHRMTKKKETEFKALKSNAASKLISEYSEQYAKEHPECSEGQANYIVSLCTSMNMPCTVENVKKLTKAEASATIDKLTRQYLFILTRRTSPELTTENIRDMSSEYVRNMIKQLLEERKLRDYRNFEVR